MATTMRIADVVRRSGFSAATLRYYEQLDLVPAPPRTTAGYRMYDDAVLDRLAFIARAKALGCSLEEISELLAAWDGGRCGPVKDRLRALAGAKLRGAHARAEELEAFTADLRRIVAGLGAPTPDGPCDEGCGCLVDTTPPVACTLEPEELAGRLRDWRTLLDHVEEREPVDGGVRLLLDSATPLDQLALLVRAEQLCCAFFAFSITVDERGVGLEVRGPVDQLVEVAFMTPMV